MLPDCTLAASLAVDHLMGTTPALTDGLEPVAAPILRFLDFLSFSESSAPHATVCVGFVFMCMYLIRTAKMQAGTRSVATHMLVTTLTVLPSILLAALLLWAGFRHPDRTVVNLGWAALTYLAWAFGGAITRLVRPDTEGADVGWLIQMSVVPAAAGLVAIGLFR